MEFENEKNVPRQSLTALLFFFYFLPSVFLALYAFYFQDNWGFICLSLLLSVGGTFLFSSLFNQWEGSFSHVELSKEKPKDTSESEEKTRGLFLEEIEQLKEERRELESRCAEELEENAKLADQIQKITKERELHRMQVETALFESNSYKTMAQEQIEELRALLNEHLGTITGQREIIEKKQQQIQQFESKIRDLNYEIKTLLHLSEKSEEETVAAKYPVSKDPNLSSFEEVEVLTAEEALMELKRCLDVGQRIVGSAPFGVSSRFKELPLENSALDLRRLFDRLQEIDTSTVFVYSSKENKMLFVNEHVQTLFGLKPEKFLQTFNEGLEQGLEEWQNAISHLSFKNESKLQLSIKARSGQELTLNGLIGYIPTGLFRHFIIGVLYPVVHRYKG